VATILVVDDEKAITLMMRLNLEIEGFDALEAHDGRQALEVIRSQPVDLVVLDIMLPEIDGWQVLQEIRADAATADLPVIMLTALSAAENMARGISYGADLYLTKPFEPDELIDLVRRLTAGSAGEG